jgi:hypothetical protein
MTLMVVVRASSIKDVKDLVNELSKIKVWRTEGFRIEMNSDKNWIAIFDNDADAVMFRLTHELLYPSLST